MDGGQRRRAGGDVHGPGLLSGDPDFPFGFEAVLVAEGGTGRLANARGTAVMTGAFTGVPGNCTSTSRGHCIPAGSEAGRAPPPGPHGGRRPLTPPADPEACYGSLILATGHRVFPGRAGRGPRTGLSGSGRAGQAVQDRRRGRRPVRAFRCRGRTRGLTGSWASPPTWACTPARGPSRRTRPWSIRPRGGSPASSAADRPSCSGANGDKLACHYGRTDSGASEPGTFELTIVDVLDDGSLVVEALWIAEFVALPDECTGKFAGVTGSWIMYARSEPFVLGSDDPVYYWWEGEGRLRFARR